MKRTFTFLLLSFIAISIALGQGRTLRGTVLSDQEGELIFINQILLYYEYF